ERHPESGRPTVQPPKSASARLGSGQTTPTTTQSSPSTTPIWPGSAARSRATADGTACARVPAGQCGKEERVNADRQLVLVVRAYRALAYVTGTVLIILCFVGIPLQVFANNLVIVKY